MIINFELLTIQKEKITKEQIFNLFFNDNSRIIYVVNQCNKLEGIITIKSFLKKFKAGEDNKRGWYSEKFSALKDNEEEMLDKAKMLMEKYHITTAYPL